jgi:acetyltransferase-like isoleucine patch superfamily enzyme
LSEWTFRTQGSLSSRDVDNRRAMIDTVELLDALQRLYREREAQLLAQWQRALPFGDLMSDRWERAGRLGLGAGPCVYDRALILGNVRVGERTWIGPFTVLDGSGGLEIGSTCSISAGVQIYTHDTVRWALSGGRAEYETAPVQIGDHSYIGPMTIVTKGVRIGRHCLVGANSIVNQDLPDYSIAYGSTCHIVGRVRVADDGRVELEYASGPTREGRPSDDATAPNPTT